MSEEMRKEFEAVWAEIMRGDDVTGRPPTRSRINPDEYCGGAAQFAWKWWQASREAMKPIKLPMWCMTSDGPSKYLLQYEVIEAIQQAGYKVAE